MEPFLQVILAVLALMATIAGSAGFWSFMMTKTKAKSSTTRLLLGLAHDRIIFLGMGYIQRGWITKDEYQDFLKYLWDPYSTFGGNGLAEKIFDQVKDLPFAPVDVAEGVIHIPVDIVKGESQR